MKIVVYALLIIYSFTILKNIIALIYLDSWMKKEKKEERKIESKEPLYLIIPMMNEQKIAKRTYLNFKSIADEIENVNVLFVTTSKEKKFEGKKSTYEILDELVKDEKNMFVCNYNNTHGVMAHQINYAMRVIKEHRKNDQKILIGIYNADSKINPNVIKYLLNKEEKRDEKDYACYQQYSWYRIEKGKSRIGIIPSASLWQTRWSLTFEMFRIRQQELMLKLYKKNIIPKFIYIIFEKMNYVIGHGFFMDMDLLEEIGGFPEETINEDAFLGYIIDNYNIKIEAVPYLEKADFAPKTSIYVKQQATWVNGPIYAFSYYSLYKEKHNLKSGEKIRALFLAFKLFLHFIYWILSPYLLLFLMPILMYIYYSIPGLIIAGILILLELPFTHYLIRLVTLSNINKDDRKELAMPSIFCIPFFLIHSFGAIRNIFLQIVGKNTKENKYKTERE